jgi:nitrite reductase/ring-hydroxylating ferredoxin subunit
MIDNDDNDSAGRWFPVARSDDAVARHIFHGRLLDQELAVWRDEAGTVNVWENRCPHRGTRLTIGSHLGNALACRYHGWRFTADGQCIAIPATPGQAPPKGACTKVFPTREIGGWIWVSLDAVNNEPAEKPLFDQEGLVLRDIVVYAPASRVVDALVVYRFVPSNQLSAPDNAAIAEAKAIDAYTVLCTTTLGSDSESIVFVVQPNAEAKATIHGKLLANVNGAHRTVALRYHNGRLSALRDRLESEGPP